VLKKNESKKINITFNPVYTAMIDGKISIYSNDPDQPTYSVPVYAGYKDFGPGDNAPDFSLWDVNYSRIYKLSELKGKIVVFTSFASW